MKVDMKSNERVGESHEHWTALGHNKFDGEAAPSSHNMRHKRVIERVQCRQN